MTAVVIYSIVTLGLGLLIGRVGMVSLCQFVLLAVGAWVALRAQLRHRPAVPRPAARWPGSSPAVIGTLIGLPALRLSGLYLALITLMAAGAHHGAAAHLPVPERRRGLLRQRPGRRAVVTAPASPGDRHGDTALLPLLRVSWPGSCSWSRSWHVRGKAGRAWAAIRQSEATAVAAGVQHHALQAVGVRAGLVHGRRGGGLLAAAAGGVNINQFPVQSSITLFAVVLMGGVYSLWGAVVAALLLRLLPALLDDWGVSTELLTILFGIGVLQVLLTAPGGLVEQVPKDTRQEAGRVPSARARDRAEAAGEARADA